MTTPRRRTVTALGLVLLGIPLALLALAGIPSRKGVGTGGKSGDTEVRLASYLPRKHARDGSVDYTDQVQRAIEASAGRTLVLPDYPVLVSRVADGRTCLLIDQPLTLRGSSASVLRVVAPGTQAIRVQGVAGVHLEGFTVEGPAGDTPGAAQGLVQVTGGSDVTIVDLTVQGADVDGIAVADSSDVRVSGCKVRGAAKSGIYLAACTRAVVSDNLVREFGGHRTASGEVVGTGIQVSSCVDVVCGGNVVAGGTGVGILCNAYANGRSPAGCVIRGNRVVDVSNVANPLVSGGIRCANGGPEPRTSTLVSGNSIERCGAYGIYVENHGGSTVLGNAVLESERSGILVGTIQGLSLEGNVVLDSDVSRFGTPQAEEAGICLINDATGVVARGNVIRNTDPYTGGAARESVRDASRVGGNALEPRMSYAKAPPASGAWRQGDRVLNTEPRPGEFAEWICVSSGSPGIWSGVGPIQ